MDLLAYRFLVLLVLALVLAQSAALLNFNSSGNFKILQVADMHWADGATTKCLNVLPEQYDSCSDLNTSSFVKRMIQAEKPDLIVFTGDNIFAADSSDPVKSLNNAFAPAAEAKVPWAAVLGNHDQESSLNREGVMSHIVGMDYTLSKLNPDSQSTIDGFGNYNLEVYGLGPDGNKTVLNLYFVDSGDYSTDPSIPGYGWVKASQQEWVKSVASSLKNIPALVYFHIPLPEIQNLTDSEIVGSKKDEFGSPKFNSGFFNTLVDIGDVKAVFTGHDHLNDFCGQLQGVYLCYSGGFGYHAYGEAGWPRRARLVQVKLDLELNGVKEISTWKRLDDPELSTIDVEVLWQAD